MMRVRTVLAGLLASTFAVSSTPALTKNVMMSAVGHTLIADYGAQGKLRFKLKADGSFTMVTPEGRSIAGHWVADDRYMCTITTSPVPKPGNGDRCERITNASAKVGSSWKQIDSYGDPVTITIERGP